MKGACFIENNPARKPWIFRGNPKNGSFLEFPCKFTFMKTHNLKEAYLSILYMCFFSFLGFLRGESFLPTFWGFWREHIRGSVFFKETSLRVLKSSCPQAWSPVAIIQAGQLSQGQSAIWGEWCPGCHVLSCSATWSKVNILKIKGIR
jgi:hypothetical protein